jgi:hypothetical protein
MKLKLGLFQTFLLPVAAIIFSVAVALSPNPAIAQWHSDSTTNTPVCTATNIQSNPKACSDAANGIIVVWEDLRSGSSSDIYAQRLDADGKPKWTVNGIGVCTNSSDQKGPIIASDENGGAYVVWEDARTLTNGIDLYAQHINADGTLSYPAGGSAVCTSIRDQHVTHMASDEQGGAYVVWEDDRNSTSGSRPDVYANRLTTAGVQWGATGKVVNNQTSQQHRPRVCADGTGGCYVAWENNATVPTSIYAQRFDATGALKWTSPNGILVYKGANSTPNAQASKNVDIRRDGNELMIAWEVTNASSSNGQDIVANRLRNDSTKLWFSPAEITGEWYGNQTNPIIYSDDSAGTAPSTNKGLMVVFNDYQDDIAPNNYQEDLVMVRMLPDGAARMPSYSNGFFNICKKPRGQVGFKVVKVEDGKLLVVWNDSRHGATDTSIYAQCVDRTIKRYFPTAGTTNQWGLPVSVSSSYLSKQVTIAPRTNGAIAAWADYRNGNYDIYAQLIFKDGSLPVELADFRATSNRAGEVDVSWQTATEQSNAGFELQRRTIADGEDNAYNVLTSYVDNASLIGNGTTSTEHNYSFSDRNVQPGIYEYRLIDVAFDGTRHAYEPKRVDTRYVAASTWSIGAIRPNPATDRIQLPVTLPVEALVDVTLFDVTGREVAHPVANQLLSAGERSLDLAGLSLPSGSYGIHMIALDPASGAVLWQSGNSPMMQILH